MFPIERLWGRTETSSIVIASLREQSLAKIQQAFPDHQRPVKTCLGRKASNLLIKATSHQIRILICRLKRKPQNLDGHKVQLPAPPSPNFRLSIVTVLIPHKDRITRCLIRHLNNPHLLIMVAFLHYQQHLVAITNKMMKAIVT